MTSIRLASFLLQWWRTGTGSSHPHSKFKACLLSVIIHFSYISTRASLLTYERRGWEGVSLVGNWVSKCQDGISVVWKEIIPTDG